MNSLEIYNIPEINNIIQDYKKDLEMKDKYKKCMDELLNLNRSVSCKYIKEYRIKGLNFQVLRIFNDNDYSSSINELFELYVDSGILIKKIYITIMDKKNNNTCINKTHEIKYKYTNKTRENIDYYNV